MQGNVLGSREYLCQGAYNILRDKRSTQMRHKMLEF